MTDEMSDDLARLPREALLKKLRLYEELAHEARGRARAARERAEKADEQAAQLEEEVQRLAKILETKPVASA